MAKRNSESRRPNSGPTTDGSTPTIGGAVEQRVVAFAEQLGRIAGTVQAKAEGWTDREALTKQLASIRDSAAELLEQLTAGPTDQSSGAPPAVAAIRTITERSGGVVDAPGKKHRKPMPAGPGRNKSISQAAKLRAARTMVKTSRRRGRG